MLLGCALGTHLAVQSYPRYTWAEHISHARVSCLVYSIYRNANSNAYMVHISSRTLISDETCGRLHTS